MDTKLRAVFFSVVKEEEVSRLPTSLDQISSRMEKAGHSVEVIRVKRPSNRALYPLSYIYAFKELLKEGRKADIMIASSPIASFLATWASKLVGKSLVYRCVDLAHVLFRQTGWKRIVYPALQIWTAKKSRLTIAVSAFVEDHLRSRGVKSEKIIVLGHGVDLQFFNPEIDGSEIRHRYNLKDKRVIAYCGKISRGYRLNALIGAFKTVESSFPEARLLLIGSGELVPLLKRKVHRLKLEDKVIFTGFVPHREVGRFLSVADVCVCTTPLFGFPLKLSEYWACMKPVVVLGKEYKSIVNDGIDAVVVRDANGMARSIQDLFRDPKRADKIGRAACQRVRSWTFVTEEFTKILRYASQKGCEERKITTEAHDSLPQFKQIVASFVPHSVKMIDIGCGTGRLG